MAKVPSRDGVFQRKDTAGWYVSYIDSGGRRKRQRVVAHTRAQAVDALNLLKAKSQRERDLGIQQVSDITVKDLFTRFKRFQKPHLQAVTYERTLVVLETLKRHLPEKLKDVSRETVTNFIAARSEQVSAGTVNKEFGTLKHVLRLAVEEWNLINSNPAAGARLPRMPEGRTRYLSPTELRSALLAAPDWMKAPLALLAFTGMRRGELLKLRWKDVDLPGRRIYLHETKNGSLRVLPVNDLAAGVLASLPANAPADLLFSDIDPHRLTVYTRRLFASLKIEGASLHSLRHTAASWLVMQGADLYAVGQLLGHKTPRMTQRYAHLSPHYLASTASKLDVAFGSVLDGTPTGLTEAQSGTKATQALPSSEPLTGD